MEKSSKLSRIIIYISVLSFIMWFGSYLTRVFVIYQLYDINTNLIVQSPINIDLPTLISVLNPIIILNILFYILFISSFFLFIFKSGINLKNEGWLFISLLIIVITLIPELFLLRYDLLILQGSYSNTPDYSDLYELITKRSEILGSFPIIELFLYLPVVYLILFRPLRLKQNEN